MFLDLRLNFQDHFENMPNNFNKTIVLLRKFQSTLPIPSFLTIQKSFIRPRLDYGDIIYDQAHNSSFNKTQETFKVMWLWLLRARLEVSSRQALVHKAMLLLYNFERPISEISVKYNSQVYQIILCNYFLIRFAQTKIALFIF